MKIIHHGRDPKKTPWRGACSNCRSELEAIRDEVTGIEYDQREKGEFGRAMCPVCSQSVVFYPIK